jgi:2-polyprenyl-3-methyl-5-hydroxy-6-metoxy-1,4-benzoquinol methylase
MTNLDPRYYANARREIEPFLLFPIHSVLEIGCGEGSTLLWLRESKGVKICRGLEILPPAAERAREKGLDIAIGNVEVGGIPFQEKNDLVLCLDVLEHLHDPWKTLCCISDSIRPGGHLIVSIPNIAHISILSDLIFNDDWKYAESGILDNSTGPIIQSRFGSDSVQAKDCTKNTSAY